MNSYDLSYVSCLSLIHPDDTFDQPITPVSNMSLDCLFEFKNSDYISSAGDETDDDNLREGKIEDCLAFQKISNSYYSPIELIENIKIDLTDKIVTDKIVTDKIVTDKIITDKIVTNKIVIDKIGDGKMEYIKDKSDREMFTNGWNAITFTNNWDFLAEQTDSFVLSNDSRIYQITKKMEELGYKGHSGISFSLTMRSMQYLLKYGEEEFKKMF